MLYSDSLYWYFTWLCYFLCDSVLSVTSLNLHDDDDDDDDDEFTVQFS